MKRGITLFMGSDMHELYEALLVGNDKRVAELGAINKAKFDKKIQDTKDSVLRKYGQETLDVFNKLDTAFKRDHYYMYGGYRWETENKTVETEEEERYISTHIYFKDGVFKMIKTDTDETGYDCNSSVVFENVSVNEILNKL